MLRFVKFDLVFLIVMALAVLLLTYLTVNLTSRITTIEEMVRLTGTIVFPVPLAVYTMYLAAGRSKPDKAHLRRDILLPVFIFIAVSIITGLAIHQIELTTGQSIENNAVAPTLINSVAILAFTVNYLTINHPRLSGLICGLLFGLALYIFVY